MFGGGLGGEGVTLVCVCWGDGWGDGLGGGVGGHFVPKGLE